MTIKDSFRIGIGNFEITPDIFLDDLSSEKAFNEYIQKLENFKKLSLNEIDFCSPTFLKDRYSSNVQNYLFFLTKLRSAKNKNLKIESIELPSYSWYLLLKTEDLLPFEISIVSIIKLIFQELKSNFKTYLNIGYFLCKEIVFRTFTISLSKSINEPELILVAPIHGKNREPYFARLLDYCGKKQRSVLLIGPSVSGQKITYTRDQTIFIESMEGIISFSRIPYLLLSLLKEIFRKFPKNHLGEDDRFYNLIKLDWIKCVESRCFSIVRNEAFLEIFFRFKKSKIFQTYEGNSWEKSVQLALKSLSDSRRVTGFLHCSILKSHSRLILYGEDFLSKPNPDLVYCTGPNARKALLSIGNYPEHKVFSGWALRERELESFNAESISSEKIALVLFEGLNTMPKFLTIILESLNHLKNTSFVIRTHPILKLNSPVFKSHWNHKNFNSIEESNISDLMQDLNRANIVIYQGTTASLYAAYLGCPLIHFNSNWWLSENPFFKLPNKLIPEFSTVSKFVELMNESKTPAFWSNEKKEYLREYVQNYLKDPSELDMEAFISSAG